MVGMPLGLFEIEGLSEGSLEGDLDIEGDSLACIVGPAENEGMPDG